MNKHNKKPIRVGTLVVARTNDGDNLGLVIDINENCNKKETCVINWYNSHYYVREIGYFVSEVENMGWDTYD